MTGETQKIVISDVEAKRLLDDLRAQRFQSIAADASKKFQEELQKEYVRSIELHGNFNSLHEAYAVLLEEVDELWTEVKKRTENRDIENIHKELIQIAAMCQKLAVDLSCNFRRPEKAQ